MRKIKLGKDSPINDREHPPGLAGFSCVSEEDVLFGIVYYAEGLNNPTIVLCHGFPGMEKNYDLAHILRQAGFNTVVFSYRGAWGSRGAFTFSGVDKDVSSIVRHIVRKKLPQPDRFDSERIVLVGHSMGGFAAFRAAAVAPYIKNIALLAVWNIGADAKHMLHDAQTKRRVDDILSGVGCLAGTTRAMLGNEMSKRAEEFDLLAQATSFAERRLLFIGAEGDVSTPIENHHRLLATALREAGAQVAEKCLDGDHGFSARRFTVAQILLDWFSEGGF